MRLACLPPKGKSAGPGMSYHEVRGNTEAARRRCQHSCSTEEQGSGVLLLLLPGETQPRRYQIGLVGCWYIVHGVWLYAASCLVARCRAAVRGAPSVLFRLQTMSLTARNKEPLSVQAQYKTQTSAAQTAVLSSVRLPAGAASDCFSAAFVFSS